MLRLGVHHAKPRMAKPQGSNTPEKKEGPLWVLLLSFSSLVQEAPCLLFLS